MIKGKFKKQKKEEVLDRDSNFQAALEYYENAKGILKKVKVDDGIYANRKPVQEACGTCYLSLLYAIDGYLLQYGVEGKDLPESYDEYMRVLKKVAVKDGKLIKMFKKAYFGLHIAGYYKGIRIVDSIKMYFSYAKWIIGHLTGKRL